MIVTFANGDTAEFPDGTPDNVIQRVSQQHGGKVASAISAPKPKEEEQDEGLIAGSARSFLHGITAGFDDEIVGGGRAITKGLYDAVKNRDISAIGNEYVATRDRMRTFQKTANVNHPVAGTAAEIAGALTTPTTAIVKIGKLGLEAVGAGRVGARVLAASPRLQQAATKAAQFVAKSPVARGVLTGAGQGALNGAGNAEDSTLDGATDGGIVGGLAGGAGASIYKLGAAGVRALKDHGAGEGARVAYEKIAKLLSAGGADDPAAVAASVQAARKGGSNMAVMDVTPGTRAMAANISRQTSIPGANKLVEAGEERIGARPAALEDKLKSLVAPAAGNDAQATRKGLDAQLKGLGSQHGDIISETGNMLSGEPMKFTPELGKVLTGGGKRWQSALKDAADRMRERDLDPLDHGFVRVRGTSGEGGLAGDGDLVLKSVPSMHTMDYIKKAVNAKIGTAMREGDNDTVSALSERLSQLRDGMAAVNPKYAESLGKMRTAHEEKNAVDLGENFLARMRTSRPGDGPQYVMSDITKLTTDAEGKVDPAKADMVRTGMMDALLKMDNSKADTVKFLRSAMKTPEQRKVMEFLLHSPDKVDDLEKFLANEGKSSVTDSLTSHGRQSGTAIYQMGGDEPVGNVVKNAFRGYAFGGVPGAISGAVRGVESLGTSSSAKDHMARILLGDGSDLVKGVEHAKGVQSLRKAKDMRNAQLIARALQQPYSDATGN